MTYPIWEGGDVGPELRHPDDMPKTAESVPTEQPLDYEIEWVKQKFFWNLGFKLIALVLVLLAMVASVVHVSDNNLAEAKNLQVITSKLIGAEIKEAQRMAGP